MNTLETIRYMGTKLKLLEDILPAIHKVTPTGGVVLDIMAGSNAVGYALKEFYTVYTNDIQEYSKVISDAVIVNQDTTISSETAKADLHDNYVNNIKSKTYNYFEITYSNTYFSKKQCCDIDSLRYAIDNISNNNKRNLYLFALMGAMCKVQSTPGHFAQYMPANHPRIIPLQAMNLYEEFLNRCNSYKEICFTSKPNKSFCMNFHRLLDENICGDVDTIYLDSPYTQEQYSRFYHVLETLVKYDAPEVKFKAKYRTDRFQSDFCYKKSVAQEFTSIFEYCKKTKTNLVISYSVKGVLAIEQLMEIAKKYFTHTDIQYIAYKHSTQGKGSQNINEVLITCTCV